MAYHRLTIAFAELSPSARAEAEKSAQMPDLPSFIYWRSSWSMTPMILVTDFLNVSRRRARKDLPSAFLRVECLNSNRARGVWRLSEAAPCPPLRVLFHGRHHRPLDAVAETTRRLRRQNRRAPSARSSVPADAVSTTVIGTPARGTAGSAVYACDASRRCRSPDYRIGLVNC